MAFQAVPNTAEVDIIYSLFGQVVENTLYFLVTGEWDETGLLDLATQVGAWATTRLLSQLSNQIHLMRVEARDLSSESGASATWAPTGDVHGAIDSPSLPGGSAFVVSLRTALGGRSYRGRNYVPGLASEAVVGNQLTSAYATALANEYNFIPTDITMGGVTWVQVSRYLDKVKRAVGVATPIITAVATDLNIDSQRRRLTGRGI